MTSTVSGRPGDELRYQSGLGNALWSEAEPGALPMGQNAPRHAPYGLFAEQMNGTGFTVHRADNRRTWMYRLRPAIHTGRWEPVAHATGKLTGDFAHGVPTPEAMRWAPQPMPTADDAHDFVDGLATFAGAGDPSAKRGMAIHLYGASADMTRAFANIDGDLVIVPQQGALHVQTELGHLQVEPGELIVVPRAIRFRVTLPGGSSRGYVAELFEGHVMLPERGPIGANGMADERHFLAPVAAYDNVVEPTIIVVKQAGELFQTVAPNSPFDVVAWHGTYAPFKYDLMRFNSLGSVSFDHPDPSILTVLTAPMDTHGRNVLDVAVFRGRWDPTEGTFRPPYYHRNSAIEFNAVVDAPSDRGPYPPGAFTYTPYLTPHGVTARGHRAAITAPDGVADAPHRVPDSSLWVQFESTYVLRVMRWALEDPTRDIAFLDGFQGWALGELATGG